MSFNYQFELYYFEYYFSALTNQFILTNNLLFSKTKNLYKTSLSNKASWVHDDKNAKSYIFPQTMDKMQTITQNRNTQKLKSTDYKNVVNSINSIISHEIEQVVVPVSVSSWVLIEPNWDCGSASWSVWSGQ